jgi:hypothetical protein
MPLLSQIDWSIKLTDVLTIIALVAGPLVAVMITERSRKNDEHKKRKIQIYKTLMATRSTTLVYAHIEAINLVEVEFHSSIPEEKRVIDAWKLYIAHLHERGLTTETWELRRRDSLADLLYEISSCLGYGHDKAQIQKGAYYPQGWVDTENENIETRKSWLEILRGNKQLPMKAEVYTTNPPTPPKPVETAVAAPVVQNKPH